MQSLERVLILKDGSIYRGEVVELVPRDYIILKLRSGSERRFSWSSIERQSMPGGPIMDSPKELPSAEQPRATATHAPEPPPPLRHEQPARAPREPVAVAREPAPPAPKPRPKAPPAAAPAESAEEELPEPQDERPAQPPRRRLLTLPPDLLPYKEDFVFVSLKSPEKDIQLEYMSDTFEASGLGLGMFWPVSLESWRVGCKYPCGELVYRKSTFRVTGRDIIDSSKFTLPKRIGPTELHVRPGSPAALGFGITISIFAGLGVLTGAVMLLVANVEATSFPPQSNSSLVLGGALTTLISGGALAGGILLTLRARTLITISQPVRQASAPSDQAVD